MGSPSPASPVTQTTQISQMDPRLYQWLYGTANSPGRQQIANAAQQGKLMQGVQNADPSAIAAYYNVPKGTDLNPFLSHIGAQNPGQADPALTKFAGASMTPDQYYKEATAKEKKSKNDPVKVKKGGEIKGYAKGAKVTQAQIQAALKSGVSAKTIANAVKSGSISLGSAKKKPSSSSSSGQTSANPDGSTGQEVLSKSVADIGVTPFYDPKTMQSTNPYYLQAVDVLKRMGTAPSEYGKASDAYSQLQGMANYKPTDVTGREAQAAQMGDFERVSAPELQQYQMNRGDVRDVNARKADVAGYDPAMATKQQFGNVRDVTGQSYDASLMGPQQREAAQQVGDIGTIQGQGYDASLMGPQQREAAQQVGDIGTIQGQGYDASLMGPQQRETAATTTGPKSWTDTGVAQQYMNPYQQNVTNIAKRESMRDYGQQMSQLKSQAAKQKAFGGTRAAVQEAEAQRNQAQRLGDIESQGLNQAYQSGMGQFQAEQGLGSQVGMSNTAQINQLTQQYMQLGYSRDAANAAAINDAKRFTATQGQAAQTQNVGNELTRQSTNANMVNSLTQQYMQLGYSRDAANAAAINDANRFTATQGQAAQTQNVGNELTRQSTNANMVNSLTQQYMQLGYSRDAANAAAQNDARKYAATSAQAAQQSNQGADLSRGQSQLNADVQTELANQNAANNAGQFYAGAQNTASNNYVQNMLQAEMANQGVDYNTAMQNLSAKLGVQQLGSGQDLQARLANQSAGLTTNQTNAQLQQQTNMANQLYGTGGFNAQTANQNAGLSANAQNTGAMGQAGQGLLGVGQGVGSYNQNLMQNWGAAGNTLQNLSQGYYDKRQQSAQNLWGGVGSATQQATGTLLGSPFGTQYQGQYQQRKKGGKLSIKI